MVPKRGDSKKIIETGRSYRNGCPEEIIENIKKIKN
jgi:hypothetical protein